MPIKRAIHIFPEFSNVEMIESLRMQYDPLFGSPSNIINIYIDY
jgi:hypothetical protein